MNVVAGSTQRYRIFWDKFFGLANQQRSGNLVSANTCTEYCLVIMEVFVSTALKRRPSGLQLGIQTNVCFPPDVPIHDAQANVSKVRIAVFDIFSTSKILKYNYPCAIQRSSTIYANSGIFFPEAVHFAHIRFVSGSPRSSIGRRFKRFFGTYLCAVRLRSVCTSLEVFCRFWNETETVVKC